MPNSTTDLTYCMYGMHSVPASAITTYHDGKKKLRMCEACKNLRIERKNKICEKIKNGRFISV